MNFFCLTFYRGGYEVVGKFSDRASNILQKGDLEMSAHFLIFSSRAGLVYLFRSPLRVSVLVAILSDYMTTHLVVFIWGSLDFHSVPCDDRGSNFSEGLLHSVR